MARKKNAQILFWSPTDRPTDTASSRVACPRLKITAVNDMTLTIHFEFMIHHNPSYSPQPKPRQNIYTRQSTSTTITVRSFLRLSVYLMVWCTKREQHTFDHPFRAGVGLLGLVILSLCTYRVPPGEGGEDKDREPTYCQLDGGKISEIGPIEFNKWGPN